MNEICQHISGAPVTIFSDSMFSMFTGSLPKLMHSNQCCCRRRRIVDHLNLLNLCCDTYTHFFIFLLVFLLMNSYPAYSERVQKCPGAYQIEIIHRDKGRYAECIPRDGGWGSGMWSVYYIILCISEVMLQHFSLSIASNPPAAVKLEYSFVWCCF